MPAPVGPQPPALPVAATLPLLVGLPVPTLHFPLSDPNVGAGNYVATNSRAPGTNNATSYQAGYGVTGGAPALLRGLSASTSTLFSRTSLGVAGSGNTLDNAGATAMTIMGVMAPNATRSGAAYWQDMLTKINTATPYAGYRFGLYWTGTKMVLYFRLQSAVTADYIEVRGTTDMTNNVPRFAAATYDGTKKAAGVSLYYTNSAGVLVLDTMTVASDTFAAGDTATNTGSISLGGMGGAQTITVGQYFDGWLSSFTPVLAMMAQPTLSAVAAATPCQVNLNPYPGAPASPQRVLVTSDSTSDIDDLQCFLQLLALHIRGEINLIGWCVTGSNPHVPAVYAAICASRGVSIPIAAYQGSDRITTASWADAAYTAFGLTKTQASFPAPQPFLRSTLAAQPNGSVVMLMIGPLQEDAALLQSAADTYSPLTGSALVAAKCIRYVFEGGYLAGGSAYNLTQAPAAGAYVFSNNPVPIWVSSDENGTGTTTAIGGNPTLCPARAAFQGWSGGGSPYYRASSFDTVAGYLAARPTTPLLTTTGGYSNGTMTVNASTGANSWSATAGTHSAYVLASAPLLLAAMETLVDETAIRILPSWSP